eukprot:g16491.t1
MKMDSRPSIAVRAMLQDDNLPPSPRRVRDLADAGVQADAKGVESFLLATVVMTTLLAKQVAAFKQQHGITAVGPKRTAAPSILFSPQEARSQDPESFASLALHGFSKASVLAPEISKFTELFEGSNDALDRKIHHLLMLLSPHLQARAAQECVEGLLYRYHVHRWNVDDLMAAALPHHDSPLFTKLVQGLHVESKPRWSWMASLKAKPASLIRSTLAKVCSKDSAILSFVGDVTLRMQMSNRTLMTFFTAIWLDTLALSVGNDLVQVAIPTVLLLLSQSQDAFYAGATITGALCVKTELEDRGAWPANIAEEHLQRQLLLKLARQVIGQDGSAAFVLMAQILQLQEIRELPPSVAKAMAKHGPEELLRALSPTVDAGNLIAMVVKACLAADDGDSQALAQGLLEDTVTLKLYGPQLCRSVIQAFIECDVGSKSAKERKKLMARFEVPARCLGHAPVALGKAMQAITDKSNAEYLEKLLGPFAAVTNSEADFTGDVQASSSHKSAKTRSPTQSAAELGRGSMAHRATKAALAEADLRTASEGEGFRAALLALALGDGEGVAVTNSLRLLKSLIVKGKKGWKVDQTMLVPILAKIAGAQDEEVRSAATALLQAVQESEIRNAAKMERLPLWSRPGRRVQGFRRSFGRPSWSS